MFCLQEKNNIKYLQSSLLNSDSLIHAFTTRYGGNATSPMDTFTLGNAGDKSFQKYVEENREKICEVLNLKASNIINPEQKHTSNVKVVSSIEDDVSNADGVITSVKGLVLLLLFADCTPIIMYAEKQKVLAIVHAGWRGTAENIVPKTISKMITEFNITPKDVKVAIGPAIGECCYPVSEDVMLKLKKSINENYNKLFKKVEKEDAFNVDLKGINAQQLIEAGVHNIDVTDYCTSCNNSLFYSYRADKGKTGRHGAVASIK